MSATIRIRRSYKYPLVAWKALINIGLKKSWRIRVVRKTPPERSEATASQAEQ